MTELASYDSPGFAERLPGLGFSHEAGMTAPGSQAANLPETSAPLSDRIQQGTVGNSAVVYGAYDSLATADVVEVGPRDTLVPAQADLYTSGDPNPLSGVPGAAVGSAGAGTGTVSTPHHPNVGVGLGSVQP